MAEIVPMPNDGGIREEVPDRYKTKFAKWKAELLATDFGRQRWNTYANDRHFVLIIRVVESRGKGAGTDKYAWDDAGDFVGAVITLGPELDAGFPSPVYYPVLNALAPEAGVPPVESAVIAAAKLAHELGHVQQAANTDPSVMRLRNKLVPEYVSIFLKNGLNAKDGRLLDIERLIGGTPTEIWEDHEYSSEVDAIRYLSERIDNERALCRILKKVRQNLSEYSVGFEKRFDDQPALAAEPCWK
jgi:hypothetical protein